MKCIMLINFKMPTIVDILTFISRINITSESLADSIFQYFSFMSILNVMLILVEHETFYNLGTQKSNQDAT